MGPRHVYVDVDANDYTSEEAVVVPRQNATPQTANLSGGPGQSSLKKGKTKGKVGDDGSGHSQEGERFFLRGEGGVALGISGV